MASTQKLEAQNPLILRSHRLMEAFAKSDDERDFYLDRFEGFIIYVDLDKSKDEIEELEGELVKHNDRYCIIPKLTFYETKKIMEGFVNEKVYDIDTKEKLLDIIQSKEARSNFLEFIYDHHTELEKWQQYYQERSRIRIIEWLRNNHFHFVFEEDLEMPKAVIEKLKSNLFQTKVGKDIVGARKTLFTKAKTYYSNEALNPRPKRGRPPKQAVKQEIEPQVTIDIYTTVPSTVRPFLFTPDISSAAAVTFSSKFETDAPQKILSQLDIDTGDINQKLASLRSLSSRWIDQDKNVEQKPVAKPSKTPSYDDEDEEEEDEDILDEEESVDFEDTFEDEDFDEDEEEEERAPLKKQVKSVPSKPVAKNKIFNGLKGKNTKPKTILKPSKPTPVPPSSSKNKLKATVTKNKPVVKSNKLKKAEPKAKPKAAPVREKKARIIPKQVKGKIKPVIKSKPVLTKKSQKPLSITKKSVKPAKHVTSKKIISKKPLSVAKKPMPKLKAKPPVKKKR